MSRCGNLNESKQMPAVAQISVNDRTPVTPVAHVYDPAYQDPVSGTWVFQTSAASPLGKEKLMVTVGKPSPSGQQKVRLVLADPVVSTDSSTGVAITTLVRTNYADLLITSQKDTTSQELMNLIGKLYNCIAAGQATLNPVLTAGARLF